jgi:hypothetical protein
MGFVTRHAEAYASVCRPNPPTTKILVKIDGNQDCCGRGFWRTLAVKRECLAPKPMKLGKIGGRLVGRLKRKKKERKRKKKMEKKRKVLLLI